MGVGKMILYQGRYSDAEQHCRHLLARRQRILGDGHPDTLTTLENLAAAVGAQGHYAEAETLYRQVLSSTQRAPDAHRTATLDHLSRLAATIARRALEQHLASPWLSSYLLPQCCSYRRKPEPGPCLRRWHAKSRVLAGRK